MEDYKEFTGKNLDEAMAAACNYFGLERGKLEIEILSDAKTGIFGLVGAKKATVRARKANIETVNLKARAERREEDKKNSQPRSGKPARPEQGKEAQPKEAPAKDAPSKEPVKSAPGVEAPAAKAEKPAPKEDFAEEAPQAAPAAPVLKEAAAPRPDKAPARQEKQPAPAAQRDERRPPARAQGKNRNDRPQRPQRERVRQPRPDKPAPRPDGPDERFPDIPLESMDAARLEAEVLAAVDAMTRHIVGETGKEFEISGGKVRVRVDSGPDSGLLIGRDGQTLAALQYLAGCIVSRRMGASVRVQIDAGDYRSRQLEKLKNTALELADKVRESGRPQSTRPMSAYLRRVVHMALADDPDLQTHSKGEGSLKRVVIVPKRK